MAKSGRDISLSSHPQFRLDKKKLIYIVIFLVGLYIVLPQLSRFHASLILLEHLKFKWLLTEAGCAFLTYIAAAMIYLSLAKKRLAFGRTLLVQFAGMFVNRILPAGIGALGVNYEYLRQQRHRAAEAAAVVAANNVIGVIGHLTLFVIIAATYPMTISQIVLPKANTWKSWLAVGLLSLVILGLIWLKKLRQEFFRAVLKLIRNLAAYQNHLGRLGLALLFSVCLTLLYTACLLAACRAIGLHLMFVQVFLILTLGVAAGTVTPTPGGLGGVEAGLAGGLLSYHAAFSDAIAAVLVYRLFTYWLPLIIGAPCFAYAERRKII